MQTLRHASRLARFVLAWFVLSLGVAVASPLVKPVDLQVVCAGASVKLVAQGDDGKPPASGHTLDCPLCAIAGAPPSLSADSLSFAMPLAHASRPIPAARIAAITAAPLPPRGPPLFLS